MVTLFVTRPLAVAAAVLGDRLGDQVDLDALEGELLGVVDQTMQPAQASLWLRPQTGQPY